MKTIISGIKGGLIGFGSALLVFTAMDFLFPMPDLATVSLDTRELVGLVEVGPGVCQFDYLDSVDGTLTTTQGDCPQNEETN